MSQNIPHTGNLRPRYMGLLLSEYINTVIFKGLPNDFKIPDDSILGFSIIKKCFPVCSQRCNP